ncbi:MAG TPA: DNA polymerase III subunit beta [Candidatus Omnitrophota bacterium]|nr:DNA polymerase III subunit beta [Candidatus Omnitrophota bacterium]HPS20571.1 DNA polymerase III subunit beta [Candidatus Omnitrophota bacterium]
MEIFIQQGILSNGIQTVQNAVTQKSSLPILANVLIEADSKNLKLTATDLDIGISTVIAVESTEQEGSITVPAKKFFDIVKAMPEGNDIGLSIKKNNLLTIKSGKSQFKIIGLPKEDFPALPIFEDKDSVLIEQKALKEMFNMTDFAISKEDARHVLTGVLFVVKKDGVTVVGTDGRRMAVVNKKLTTPTLVTREVIIPIKTVQEVKRLLSDEGEVKISFSDNQIQFSFSSVFIISRLIEGEYPDYKKVIPEKSNKIVSILRNDFLNAAKRVSIFTDQESQAVKIKIQKKKMIMSKTTQYLGEAMEEVNIEYSGENEVEIGFNPRYLMDVLKGLSEEEVNFEINDQNKPGVIRSGEEYVYVVLPMQIVE